mmetsp:Transcript_2521/g.3499  ORF Transcript_2521/g.3499 Transcript_2521/m.3499 type:complete len:97 (+) Transcript_2521:192-482(+)
MWKKWKLYPGAVTVLIPRVIWGIFVMLSIAIFLNIILIGHDRQQPLGPIRRTLSRGFIKISVFFLTAFSWWTVLTYRTLTPEQVGFYEEFLGPIEE